MEILALILDFLLHLDQHLAALIADYGIWVYAILFLIVFLETGVVVAPFLPGDSLLFVAGTLAAVSIDEFYTIEWLMLVLFVAAVLGNTSNYWIGRFIGDKILTWRNGKLIKKESLEKTQAFYDRHGGKTIVISRFLPIIRTFAPFVAGIGKMPHMRFQCFNVSGGALWVVSFTLLGYFFGNIPLIRDNLSLIVIAVIALSFVPIVIFKLLDRKYSK